MNLWLIATSSVLAVLIMAASFLSRDVSPRLRHRLCVLGVLLLVGLPVLLLMPGVAVIATDPVVDEFSTATSETTILSQLTSVVFSFWLVGFAVALVRLGRDWWALRELRKQSLPAEAGAVALMAEVVGELGLSTRTKRCELRVSPTLEIPLICGTFRPMVILPISSREWTEEMTRVVLSHELCHLKQGDLKFLPVVHLVAAFYWFHPLIRKIVRQWQDVCESASDAAVIASGVEARRYVNVLCDLASSAPTQRVRLATAMAGEPSLLRQRVEQLTGESAPTRHYLVFAAMGLLVSSAVALGLARALPQEQVSQGIEMEREVELRLSADPFPAD